jgi:hypothetical protein
MFTYAISTESGQLYAYNRDTQVVASTIDNRVFCVLRPNLIPLRFFTPGHQKFLLEFSLPVTLQFDELREDGYTTFRILLSMNTTIPTFTVDALPLMDSHPDKFDVTITFNQTAN